MKVIVAGCGRVGAMIAGRLMSEGHDVAVIDKDPLAFERLGQNFTGQMITGMVFDRDAIEKAGIDKADAFISVTSGDNSNIISAIIAREIFRVPRVVARIYEPRRAEIYRRLGVPTVSSVAWASNEIFTLVLHSEIAREAIFGDGEVQLLRFEISPWLTGKAIDDLSIPGEVKIVAIVRSGKSFIPTRGSIFEERDIVEAAVSTNALPKLKEMVSP